MPQLDLFAEPTPAPALPDLTVYDVLLINSSAGKDSQAMLDVVAQEAAAAGVIDRAVVVHADLGDVEWPGTRQLAEQQAGRYGIRFEVCSAREGLLEWTARRGMWPDSARRWCTSDLKRGPIATVITRLVAELGLPRRARGAEPDRSARAGVVRARPQARAGRR